MKFLTDQFQCVEMPESFRPVLLRNLRCDLAAKSVWFYGAHGRMRSLRMLLSDGSLCAVLYRMMAACHRWRLGPLAAVLYKLNAFLTGAVLGRGAVFGPGLVVLHSVALVVNTAVRGGTNVVLEGGVTVGAEKGRSPVLGDRVFIGSGAKVIGGLRVGHAARIGANAVVVKDVPDGGTAVGIPAQIVRIRSEAV